MTLNVRENRTLVLEMYFRSAIVHIIFVDKKVNIHAYIIKQIGNPYMFSVKWHIRAISWCDEINKKWKFSKITL